MSEPGGASGLKIFPLRKFLGETLVSNQLHPTPRHLGVFLVVGVPALVLWPHASVLSRVTSLRDPFLGFKPKNPKNLSYTLMNIFFFLFSRNPVYMSL